MESDIRDTLMSHRRYMAERHVLETDYAEASHSHTADEEERLAFLNRQIKRVDAWLMLLSDDERFVVENHLIAGVDIPRIVVLYQERWGNEFAKSERTIKSYQKLALRKIASFEERLERLVSRKYERLFSSIFILFPS